MKRRFLRQFAWLTMLLTLAGSQGVKAEPATGLKPLMVQTDKVVLSEDFEKTTTLDPKRWEPGQETRWKVENGLLTGIPATAEFQKGKEDHNGAMSRMNLRDLPQDVAIAFSFRLRDGNEGNRGGFFEVGHHVGRVMFNGKGLQLVVTHEGKLIASAKGFRVERNKWYHVLAEIKNDEIVVQFKDGPTLYGKDPFLATKKNGFGIAGFAQGTVDLDNVTAWTIKPELQPTWEAARAKFPPPPATQPAKAAGKAKTAGAADKVDR